MQEGSEPVTLQQLQLSLDGGEEESSRQSEAPGNDIKEELKKLLNEEDVLEEGQSERVEKTQEVNMMVEEEEKDGVSNLCTADLDLAPSAQKASSQSASLAAHQTPSSKSDLINCVQQCPPAITASHLTKHDKRIIEKIRSYYEAAAKAQEDEAEEDGELEYSGESRRRNSFSHIPSGLVKESVSRLDEFGHLGESESEKIQSQFNKAGDRNEDPTCSVDRPIANPSEILADPEDHGDETKCSQNEFLTPSKVLDTPGQVASIQDSPATLEDEAQESDRKVNIERADRVLEVIQNEQNSLRTTGQEDGPYIAKENISSEETRATGIREQISSKEGECKQSRGTEPHRSTKELPKDPIPYEVQCCKSSTKYQSSWVRKKPRDLTKVCPNVDGQWSYHSRIVKSNRALFEAMGSDVASIGLFEAHPEVDPVLIENSERILSKVQTLAQMFGTKAGSMKMPLHQKRGATIQGPLWDVGSWCGNSLEARKENKTHVQIQQHKGKDPNDSHNDSEAKRANQRNVSCQSQEKTEEEGKVQEQKAFTPSGCKFFKKLGLPSLNLSKYFVCYKVFAYFT